MKIVVCGGTQGIGLEVVKQALSQGHEVTVFARTPSKLDDILSPAAPATLKVVKGDAVTSSEDLIAETVKGSDAVVISLGATMGGGKRMLKVCSTATPRITQAMIKEGVARLVVVSSNGVAESIKDLGYFGYFLLKYILGALMADKGIQEEGVKASGLSYTIIRPAGLNNLPLSGGKYTVAEHASGQGIARADVAELCLKALSSELLVNKTVAIVGN